jgi:hypothetical protein
VLGAVVLVVAIFALREPKGHVNASSSKRTVITTISSSPTSPAQSKSKSEGTTSASTRQTSSPPTSSSSPGVGVKSVPLVVLNNTTTQGLAHQAADRFEAGGWTVTRYANYTNDILSTCAYYDPAVSGAKAAATALRGQYPTIKRVQPKFSGLPNGPVVVVLTPDYSSG